MKFKLKNIIFLVLVALFIIPQTRKPIQVFLNKGLALISPSITNTGKAQKLSSYNYNFVDKSNAVFSLEEAKGKVVLINYWATWCPPCIAEMPSLQKLYNDYHNTIEFLFITPDGFTEVDAFLNKNKYTFKVHREQNNAFSKHFNINTIPRTFLIDKVGNIVIDETGSANWNSTKVRNTINKLISE